MPIFSFIRFLPRVRSNLFDGFENWIFKDSFRNNFLVFLSPLTLSFSDGGGCIPSIYLNRVSACYIENGIPTCKLNRRA